jgi:hypothetical protein
MSLGKTPLTREVRSLVPAAALDGLSAIGSGGRFLPLAGAGVPHRSQRGRSRLWPSLHFADTRDYVMWVVGAATAALGDAARQTSGLSGAALRDRALQIIHGGTPTSPA